MREIEPSEMPYAVFSSKFWLLRMLPRQIYDYSFDIAWMQCHLITQKSGFLNQLNQQNEEHLKRSTTIVNQTPCSLHENNAGNF